MIFGRTDLRKGASKAKFDAGADFDVRLAVAPRKRHEKLIFRSENFGKKNFRAKTFFDPESLEMRFGKVSRRGLDLRIAKKNLRIETNR